MNREAHKRSASKVNIRRNLSISHVNLKKKKHSNKNLSEDPSRSHMLQTANIDHTYTENDPPQQNPAEGENSYKEAEVEPENPAQVCSNITIVPNTENPQSVNNSTVTVSFVNGNILAACKPEIQAT